MGFEQIFVGETLKRMDTFRKMMQSFFDHVSDYCYDDYEIEVTFAVLFGLL